MKPYARRIAVITLIALASLPAFPQTPPPEEPAQHGISGVDAVRHDGAVSTPLPERQKRRLKRYEIPELSGARQAIGSQLIAGELPNPILDYSVRTSAVDQRISFFEGGLIVIRMIGAGGSIHKRVLI